jgi:endonuclease/exonuclease/phosphatase family metal-dependent hydrolase
MNFWGERVEMACNFMRAIVRWLLGCCIFIIQASALELPVTAADLSTDLAPPKAEGVIRVATFNVSFNRSEAGGLTKDLTENSVPQIQEIAAIIRAVQPDILLLNEVDYCADNNNGALFHEHFLANSQRDLVGGGPWEMPFLFSAPVNTGVPSGLDLNRNGRTDDPEDAWGFGRFPGQYGMAVLSRFEIDVASTRTFQHLLWSDLPGALVPRFPDSGEPYYSDEIWNKLRLPSKSLWDVRISIPGGQLHFIVSHPTPPVFDGPEDRNGCRNHDEIRLLTSYIEGQPVEPTSRSRGDFWMDDQGRSGGLPAAALFVIAGDLNSDPFDGDSRREALLDLLGHRRVISTPVPSSRGAIQASQQQGGKNREHQGDPAHDTADFNDFAVGNLRVDYVLPSTGLNVIDCGVVWPEVPPDTSPSTELIKQLSDASDHHMVWVDLRVSEQNAAGR